MVEPYFERSQKSNTWLHSQNSNIISIHGSRSPSMLGRITLMCNILKKKIVVYANKFKMECSKSHMNKILPVVAYRNLSWKFAGEVPVGNNGQNFVYVRLWAPSWIYWHIITCLQHWSTVFYKCTIFVHTQILTDTRQTGRQADTHILATYHVCLPVHVTVMSASCLSVVCHCLYYCFRKHAKF